MKLRNVRRRQWRRYSLRTERFTMKHTPNPFRGRYDWRYVYSNNLAAKKYIFY